MMSRTCQIAVLVGHPFVPIGRGEDIRCSFRAFRATGLTLPIYDIYSRETHFDADVRREISNHLVQGLSSNINIFHINGDEVQQCLTRLSTVLPCEAYNIIYPQWELSTYPREWAEQLNCFDEIWAPSKFVFDSIRGAVSKPVFHMPLPVGVRLTSFLGRSYFALPQSCYLFLFFFDFSSYIDRKNPFAVIEAFERVCAARRDENMCLVIKLNRHIKSSQSEEDFQRFIMEINRRRHRDRVIIIDRVLTDSEMKNLIRCCDCFVSLHRSEGFGRGMAEAMYLGKPVVATGYSGNLDFMSEANSCLVRYNLIKVEEGQYPYAKGQVWAEPDVDHAAYYMVRLLDDRDWGRKLGQIASRYIRTYFNYRAIGWKYREHLDKVSSRQQAACP